MKLGWLAYSMFASLVWGVQLFLWNDARSHVRFPKILIAHSLAFVVVGAAAGLFLPRALDANPDPGDGRRIGWAKAAVAGVCAVIGVIAFQLALSSGGGLASVATVASTSAVVVALLGWWFSGQRLTGAQWSGIGLAIVAVYLVTPRRPDPTPSAAALHPTAPSATPPSADGTDASPRF